MVKSPSHGAQGAQSPGCEDLSGEGGQGFPVDRQVFTSEPENKKALQLPQPTKRWHKVGPRAGTRGAFPTEVEEAGPPRYR